MTTRKAAYRICALTFQTLGLAVAALLSTLRALAVTPTRSAFLAAALIFLSIAVKPCAAQGTGASIDETAITRAVYVDPILGNDSNSGTQSSPFKTINHALSVAAGNLSGGTRIWLNDGIYREAMKLTAWQADSSTAPLIIQAVNPGRAAISGSDVWTGWSSAGGGIYTHMWPYSWGFTTPPSGWPLPAPSQCPSAQGCMMLRREMLFVNGVALKQQLAGPLSSAGTFYVNGRSIMILPPAGTDMSTATVEVATRSGLFETPYGIVNLVLCGLVFQRDNSAVNGNGNGAVNISGTNLLVDQCQFNQNNFVGLNIVSAHDITVQNSQAEYNGENGVSMWEVNNLRFSSNEASYNNWRGAAAGFTGFDADGTKVTRIHGATFSYYTAIGNQTGGLWLDTDDENIVIENSVFARNLTKGLFIEINQGPFKVESNTFCSNGLYGLASANSALVTANKNVFYGNGKQALFFGGSDSPVTVKNYETGQTYSLYLQDWTLQNNSLLGNSFKEYLINTGLTDSWPLFVSSLNSNYNNWYVPGNNTPFSLPSGVESLSMWQSTTGEDLNSSSSSQSVQLPPACSTSTAMQPITLGGITSATADGVRSIALTMPTGVQTNDVLIAQIAAYSTGVETENRILRLPTTVQFGS
jgi:hypothetical protein